MSPGTAQKLQLLPLRTRGLSIYWSEMRTCPVCKAKVRIVRYKGTIRFADHSGKEHKSVLCSGSGRHREGKERHRPQKVGGM